MTLFLPEALNGRKNNGGGVYGVGRVRIFEESGVIALEAEENISAPILVNYLSAQAVKVYS